jgi:hypothetical protein
MREFIEIENANHTVSTTVVAKLCDFFSLSLSLEALSGN